MCCVTQRNRPLLCVYARLPKAGHKSSHSINLGMEVTPGKKQTLTRDDLAEAVRIEIGLSGLECSILVASVFDTIRDGLVRDGSVKLSGFGNFIVLDKRERVGRNPRTGCEAKIERRRVVKFRASKILTERVSASLARKHKQ